MEKNSILVKAFFVSATLLILMLSSLLVKQSFVATPSLLGVSDDRTNLEQQNSAMIVEGAQTLNIASKILGTTERIVIEADPEVSNANIWLIRLKIRGGEILEVNNLVDSMLPACANKKEVNVDEVCVDVVKEGNFAKGDKAIEIVVNWDDPDGGEIYRMSQDAYYNGESLDYSNLIGPKVAGASTTASSNVTVSMSPTTIILIIIGLVLIGVAGVGFYMTLRNPNKSGSMPTSSISGQSPSKILVMSSIVMMTAGTVFSAAFLTNNTTAPEDTSALLPNDNDESIVTNKPTNTPTNTPINTPTSTPTLTPTLTFTPTVLPTYFPTYTVRPTIIYYTVIPTSSPTPTVTPISKPPLTDNVVCGPIDVNGDLKLDYIDYVVFSYMYGYHCSDTYPAVGCGGKDTNGDGVINYIDLGYFQMNYFPKNLNCSVED